MEKSAFSRASPWLVGAGDAGARAGARISKGYIIRLPDPQDRRGTLVQLTDNGVQIVNQAVELHLRNEHRLIATLSDEERKQLTRILRHWLKSFES